MAYSFAIVRRITSVIEGRSHRSFTIRETDVSLSDQWYIDGLPPFVTMTLFEAAIETHPTGGDTTISPRLGTELDWIEDSIDHLVKNLKPLPRVQSAYRLPITSPQGRIVGKSCPPTSIVIPSVITRLSFVVGH